MSNPRSRRLPAVRVVLAIVAAAAAGGCTATPGASGAAGASSAAASTPSATPASATPTATPPAAESVSPSSAPSAAEPSLEPPPGATLVAGNGSHPGEIGSWAWAGGTSDSPWLPAQALERADVSAGTVTVALDVDVEVESWMAVAAGADDAQGVDLEPLGDGSGEPSFQLASGEWVVAVDVRFADGLGSAVYYWHLVVT